MQKDNYSSYDIEYRSLADVRQQIDHLDTVLITLLAERSKLIDEVIKLKGRIDTVSPERMEKALEDIRSLAQKENMDPVIAENIYRKIIDIFVRQQRMKMMPSYAEIKKSYY